MEVPGIEPATSWLIVGQAAPYTNEAELFSIKISEKLKSQNTQGNVFNKAAATWSRRLTQFELILSEEAPIGTVEEAIFS